MDNKENKIKFEFDVTVHYTFRKDYNASRALSKSNETGCMHGPIVDAENVFNYPLAIAHLLPLSGNAHLVI